MHVSSAARRIRVSRDQAADATSCMQRRPGDRDAVFRAAFSESGRAWPHARAMEPLLSCVTALTYAPCSACDLVDPHPPPCPPSPDRIGTNPPVPDISVAHSTRVARPWGRPIHHVQVVRSRAISRHLAFWVRIGNISTIPGHYKLFTRCKMYPRVRTPRAQAKTARELHYMPPHEL